MYNVDDQPNIVLEFSLITSIHPSLCHPPGPSRDATGAQEVLQLGRHQRPPERVYGATAAAVGADNVDAAVNGTEKDVILAEGDGRAHGESYLWNGEKISDQQSNRQSNRSPVKTKRKSPAKRTNHPIGLSLF